MGRYSNEPCLVHARREKLDGGGGGGGAIMRGVNTITIVVRRGCTYYTRAGQSFVPVETSLERERESESAVGPRRRHRCIIIGGSTRRRYTYNWDLNPRTCENTRRPYIRITLALRTRDRSFDGRTLDLHISTLSYVDGSI